MYVSSHHDIRPILFALIGGPMTLVWGLRKLNEKRLLENTPVSRVRSAAIGLVELNGMARPLKSIQSPLTHLDCCWWVCVVEELRSNGKSSYWAKVKEVGSLDPFYLEDVTGRVLVNPAAAELHVSNHTLDLNATTRTQLAPVLNGWGLNDMNWFGGEKRLRIREQSIPEAAPVFIMGELISTAAALDDRKERFNEYLRAIKADPQKMAEADVNHDGVVDADEWAAFEQKMEEEFLKQELSRHASMPNQDNMLIKAPAGRPFVISTAAEQELVSSYAWSVPLAVIGGVAACAFGVWLALVMRWQTIFIVGLLGVGFGLSLFTKVTWNGISGRSQIWD